MPKEAVIRKKAVKILENGRWVTWRGPKIRFKQTDIFGAFDMVCWQKGTGELKFIQLTTLPNLSTRRKKIKSFFKKNKINRKSKNGIKAELWGWSKKDKKFKIELI